MPIIGIDLGTSNSAAAVLRVGRPVIIPSVEGITVGGKAFQSYVALTADGQMLIGAPARRQATVNPVGTATAAPGESAAARSRILSHYLVASHQALASRPLRRLAPPLHSDRPVCRAHVPDERLNALAHTPCIVFGLRGFRLVDTRTASKKRLGFAHDLRSKYD